MSAKHLLTVINLGKRSFADALRTQEVIRQRLISKSQTLAFDRSKSRLPTATASASTAGNKFSGKSDAVLSDVFHHEHEPQSVLLLMEHWPVFTAGLRDSAFTDKDVFRLKALGADVFRTNRGGLATFHGPGQLVAYPILNLKEHGLGLREYVEKLERTLVDTCLQLGVKAKTTHETGVWVEDRKIGSIGVNAKRHVTLHGVSLNCDNDLSWFDHITPCGLEGVTMTSLTEETGRAVQVSETECRFLDSFAHHFDCEVATGSDYVPAAMQSNKKISAAPCH